jgi:hypothetical protein
LGSRQLLIEGVCVEEMEVLGSVDDALEAVGGERGGEVDEGAGEGGDGQAVVVGDVCGMQGSAAVDSDGRRGVGRAEGRDVELRG